MTHVEMWAALGVGRITALSKRMGVSRQYISKNLNSLDASKVLVAINEVEQYEMKIERCVINNILGAAKHTKSKNEALRDRAYFALASWSEIYSDMCKNNVA